MMLALASAVDGGDIAVLARAAHGLLLLELGISEVWAILAQGSDMTAELLDPQSQIRPSKQTRIVTV